MMRKMYVSIAMAITLLVGMGAGLSHAGVVLGGSEFFLNLTPDSDTNEVGGSQTLTAVLVEEVFDDRVFARALGTSVEGASILFEVVSGPHEGVFGFEVTDANGEASFSYDGLSAGLDTITASAEVEVGDGDRGGFLQIVPSFNNSRVLWVDDFVIVRTPRRNPRRNLRRPDPDVDAVRCVETEDPLNPDFGSTAFTLFDLNDEAEVELLLSEDDGVKEFCCQYRLQSGGLLPPVCGEIELVEIPPVSNLAGRAKRGKVNLTWTPSADADTEEVFRGTDAGGPYELIGTSTNGVFADFNATAGETFFYVVRSVLDGTATDDSNEAAVSVPAPRSRRR